jgi:hypothetical protein
MSQCPGCVRQSYPEIRDGPYFASVSGDKWEPWALRSVREHLTSEEKCV